MNTFYNCSMSAGFGFAAVVPPPPPFFDDGHSLHFAVYVFLTIHHANGSPSPPILAALVVPGHAFVAAPVAVTINILSAAGVAVPPDALHPFAMRMSSFASSAAAAFSAYRILPLCVHVTALTCDAPLTFHHLCPLTYYYPNHSEVPAIRPSNPMSEYEEDETGDDDTAEASEVAADLNAATEKLSSPESYNYGDDDEEDEQVVDRESETALRFEDFFSEEEDESTESETKSNFLSFENFFSDEDEHRESQTELNFLSFENFFSDDDDGVLDDDGGILRNLFGLDYSDDGVLANFVEDDAVALRSSSISGETSVQLADLIYRTTTVRTSIEEEFSSLRLLLEALSASLSRRRAILMEDIDRFNFGNNSGTVVDRDDHVPDGSESDDDDDDDDDSDDSFGYYDDDDDINVEEFMFGIVPATESSIEALEVVKVSTRSRSDNCAICLDDFSFSIESNGHDYDHEYQNLDHHHHVHDLVIVVRMPCSHLYHKVCIAQWLAKSHFCPLCRYSMPTYDSISTVSNYWSSLQEASNASGMNLSTREDSFMPSLGHWFGL